jgi:hypothetical protein
MLAMRHAVVSLTTGLFLTTAAATGFAQVTFTVNPNVGMYIPHGGLLFEAPSHLSPLESKKPVGGAVFTTRVAAWVTPHLGFEGSLSYTGALIAVKSHEGNVEDMRQTLILSSIRSVYRFPGDKIARLGFQVGSGLGLVNRSGKAWANTPTGPAMAFVVSGGVRAQLSPKKPIAFRMELEDYISWAQFKLDSGAYTRGRAYHDLVYSLGVMIPMQLRN